MENNENNENNPNELPEHETGAEMGNDNFTPSEYNNPPPPPPLTPPPPAYPYPQPPPYGAGYYHTPTPYPVPQYQYGGENPEWRSNKNGQIAAFVLSLLGFFAGVFTAIPGVITGVIFYKKAQKLGAPTGFSVAAIIIGTAITVINILFFALFFAILAGVYSASIVPSSAVYDVVKEGNEYYAVEKTYEGYEPEPSNDSVNIAVYKSPDNKQLCVQGSTDFNTVHIISKDGYPLFSGERGSLDTENFDDGSTYIRSGVCDFTSSATSNLLGASTTPLVR